MTTGAPIRVMTWNIHGGIGSDGRCDPERTLARIARHRPDILALQEIDGRVRFRRRPRAFETFAAGLGDHVVEARLVTRGDRDGDYGHLLWSRWPFRSAVVHRLPGGLEPRGVIDAVSLAPGGPLRILSTHFGLSPAVRRRQARFLAELASASPPVPTIVVGDFNDWRMAGSVQTLLGALFPRQVAPRTWPARCPLARMDRVYASSGIELAGTAADPGARQASDHLPVIVDIRCGTVWNA